MRARLGLRNEAEGELVAHAVAEADGSLTCSAAIAPRHDADQASASAAMVAAKTHSATGTRATVGLPNANAAASGEHG